MTAVDLASNHGQHTATFCGLALSTGDFVVTLDDDMQQSPDEIARLIEKAEAGHDLVCGQFRRTGAPIRRFGSWTIGLLDRLLLDKPAGFVFSSFRLMRRDVVDRRVAMAGTTRTCAAYSCAVHQIPPTPRSSTGQGQWVRVATTQSRSRVSECACSGRTGN